MERELSLTYARISRRQSHISSFLNGIAVKRTMKRIGIDRFWTYTMGAFPDWTFSGNSVLRGVEVIDPVFFGDPAAQWRSFARVSQGAELVAATAEALVDELGARSVSAHLLQNAVSERLINPGRDHPTGPPMIAYIGTLDWRFDADLLAATAGLLPDCHFSIAGRVLPEVEPLLQGLRSMTNVEILGAVSEAEKESLLAQARVGIVPFQAGPIADGVNPTKVYEYCSYGLPVVTASSIACRALSPPVRVAVTSEEFAEAIREALEEGARSPESFRFAEENTWRHRAERLHLLLLGAEERSARPRDVRRYAR